MRIGVIVLGFLVATSVLAAVTYREQHVLLEQTLSARTRQRLDRGLIGLSTLAILLIAAGLPLQEARWTYYVAALGLAFGVLLTTAAWIHTPHVYRTDVQRLGRRIVAPALGVAFAIVLGAIALNPDLWLP